LAELEREVNAELPVALRGLLEETNGVTLCPAFPEFEEEPYKMSLIWSVEEIRRENLDFREFDATVNADGRFEALAPLLFFANEPDGDFLAFRLVDGRVADPSVLRMSHEDCGSREVVAPSLREYLTQLLSFVASREGAA
jgi:hypothetical protein